MSKYPIKLFWIAFSSNWEINANPSRLTANSGGLATLIGNGRESPVLPTGPHAAVLYMWFSSGLTWKDSLPRCEGGGLSLHSSFSLQGHSRWKIQHIPTWWWVWWYVHTLTKGELRTSAAHFTQTTLNSFQMGADLSHTPLQFDLHQSKWMVTHAVVTSSGLSLLGVARTWGREEGIYFCPRSGHDENCSRLTPGLPWRKNITVHFSFAGCGDLVYRTLKCRVSPRAKKSRAVLSDCLLIIQSSLKSLVRRYVFLYKKAYISHGLSSPDPVSI